MSDCVECKTQIVSGKCVRLEQELSFDYSSLSDALLKLDKNSQSIKELIESPIDKMWIKTSHKNIVGYLQDVIVQIDVILNTLGRQQSVVDTKFNLSSSLVTGEKSLLQLLNIAFKEIEALKNKNNSNSALYVP